MYEDDEVVEEQELARLMGNGFPIESSVLLFPLLLMLVLLLPLLLRSNGATSSHSEGSSGRDGS